MTYRHVKCRIVLVHLDHLRLLHAGGRESNATVKADGVHESVCVALPTPRSGWNDGSRLLCTVTKAQMLHQIQHQAVLHRCWWVRWEHPAWSSAFFHCTWFLLSGFSLWTAAVGSAVPVVPLKSSGLQEYCYRSCLEHSGLFKGTPLSIPMAIYLPMKRIWSLTSWSMQPSCTNLISTYWSVRVPINTFCITFTSWQFEESSKKCLALLSGLFQYIKWHWLLWILYSL